MQLNPLSVALLIPAVILLVLAFMAWRRGGRPGAVSCGFLLLSASIYAFGYGVELSATTIQGHMNAVVLEYVGIAFIPTFIIMFGLQFMGHDEWLNPFVLGLLFFMSAVTFALACTNEHHGLIYLRVWLQPIIGQHTQLMFKAGLWYVVNILYINLSLFLVVILFINQRFKAKAPYRRQLDLMIICCAYPWAGHLVYVLGFSPYGLDLSPFALTITGAGFVLGLRRYRLFDLIPIAREVVFDGMHEGVLVLDTKQRIVDVNPTGTHFTGVSKEMIGQPFGRLPGVDSGRAEDFGTANYEIYRREADPPFWIEANISPLEDRGGRPLGRLIVMRDITERKTAEAERLDMERRLLHSQRLESLGVLAGGIAHDFNNILMVIHGNLEMARMHSETGSTVHVNLDSAMHGVRRAADLTRQMLAYAGKGQFKLEPLDLNSLAEETVAFLNASVGRNITLHLERGAGLPPFRADRGQIEQVIMNIVLNGAEAIGENRGTVVVRTRALDCTEADFEESRIEEKPGPGRYLALEVEDDGSGMDEKTLHHLFDPFYSTKFVGRGLGMSAVLGIVRTHKGAILVDTEPGRGSSLRVFFPTLEKTPEEKAGRAGEGPSVESWDPISMAEMEPIRGTVLVVDDDIPVQVLCTSALKRFGLTVLMASNAEEALDRLNEWPDGVDCMIVACGLEGRDGRSAFESLMAAAQGAKGVLAGKAESQERERVSGVPGYAGFLEKPYRLKSLYEAMRRVLGA